MSIILLFFGAVCWVHLTIGLGLIAVYVLVLTSAVLVSTWVQNNYVATKTHVVVFATALACCGGLGLVAGYNKQSFLIGYTLFWSCLVVLAMGYYLYIEFGPKESSWTAPHYDNVLLYPTYCMDRSDNRLMEWNGPSQGIGMICSLLIIWGFVASGASWA